MRISQLISSRLFLLTFSSLLFFSIHARASEFDIDIHLEKEKYQVGEILDGHIDIKNLYPATLPVTFHSEVYHNGEIFLSRQTFVKTFYPGTITFRFKTFQIPTGPFHTDDIGEWMIVIRHQQSDEEHIGRADFVVTPAR